MTLRMGFSLKARTLTARKRNALPGHAKPRINARAMRAIPRFALSVYIEAWSEKEGAAEGFTEFREAVRRHRRRRRASSGKK
jgi:hypothetical protein